MEFSIILYFFAIFGFVVGNLRPDVGECGDPLKSYNLNAGDMFMVQSPNFPKSLVSFGHGNVTCDLTLTRADGKDFGLYFIFTNGYTFGYKFSSPNGEIERYEEKFDGHNENADGFAIYDSNSQIELFKAKTSINFGYGYGSSGNSGTTVLFWSAFQAFVYAPESVPTTNCWMNGQTFDLTDDKKIIPLFSQQIFNHYENCSWTVNMPDDTMKMKLTIPKLFMPEGSNYEAKVIPDGGTPVIMKQGMSQEITGTTFLIQFTVSKTAKEFNPDFIGFFGLVTAVKRAEQQPTTFKCRTLGHNNKKTDLLFNSGYDDLSTCTLSIPYVDEPNSIIIFQAQERYMEYLADKLQIFENATGTETLVGDINDYVAYAYEGEPNIYFRFTSDKNINGAGFIVPVFPISCECANETFIAPCQGSELVPIMPNDLESDKKLYTYCQDMACQYEIVSNPDCSENQILVEIKTNLKSQDDIVVFAYDKKEIWNSTDGDFTSESFDPDKTLDISFLAFDDNLKWTKTSNILITVSTTPVMTTTTEKTMPSSPTSKGTIKGSTTTTKIHPLTSESITSTTTEISTSTTPEEGTSTTTESSSTTSESETSTTSENEATSTTEKSTTKTSTTSTISSTQPTTVTSTTTTTTPVPTVTSTTAQPTTSGTTSSTTTPIFTSSSTTTTLGSTPVAPVLIHLTLIPSSPAVSIQLDFVKVVTIWYINTANTTDTLDLFISLDETNSSSTKLLEIYTLQDGNDPMIKLSDVKSSSDQKQPRLYVSKSGTLTITGQTPAPITLFFRLRQTHSANCPSSNNVFQPNPEKAFDFSFDGGNNGKCMSTLLAYGAEYPRVALQGLSTNSNATVSVVVGVDPNHRYFDFNAQTANLWNSVVLTGSYNSIVVPEKAVVTSKSSFTTAPVQSVPDITAAQGVVYSMNYVVAGYSGYKTEKPTAVAVLKGRPSTTVVTCRVLEIVKGDVVQVVQGSNTISVTTLNQTMSFSDSSDITFYYKNTDVSKKGFLFEFHQAAASSFGIATEISFIILLSNVLTFLFLF